MPSGCDQRPVICTADSSFRNYIRAHGSGWWEKGSVVKRGRRRELFPFFSFPFFFLFRIYYERFEFYIYIIRYKNIERGIKICVSIYI